MTTVSPVTQEDVDALKCLYFQNTKTLIEIDWYGLDCDRKTIISNLELSYAYLNILQNSCEVPYKILCEIKAFVKKLTSVCIFTNTKCNPKYTVTPIEPILTETSLSILTENDIPIYA